MPTLLPAPPVPRSFLQPLYNVLRSLRQGVAGALGIARTVAADEASQPARTLEDLAKDDPLLTQEGKRIKAREAEARAWDL